jgi:hypothetical protein
MAVRLARRPGGPLALGQTVYVRGGWQPLTVGVVLADGVYAHDQRGGVWHLRADDIRIDPAGLDEAPRTYREPSPG